MAGRANIFRYIRLQVKVSRQIETLHVLEKDLKNLRHKMKLVEIQDKDYIDELLRKKLNKFPPNTYQIKEED